MAQGRENARKRIEKNKHILFDFLDVNGIEHAEIKFNGAGDSGGIESVEFYDKHHKLYPGSVGDDLLEKPLPDIKSCVGYSISSEGGWVEVFDEAITTVKGTFESICYDALKVKHEGWENDDGAYGSVTFDTEKRTVALEYHERSIQLYEYEF